MAKIAFIGSGSFGFTRGLVKDLLTFPRLQDATLALMDVDRERLSYIRQAVERIVREGQLMVYKHTGFWSCMDTLRDLQRLEKLWNDGKAGWKIWS